MDQTATESLVKYIKQARDQGLDNRQIIGELRNAGWEVHDILNVVLEHVNTVPQAPPAPIQQQPDNNIISVQNVSKSYGKKVKALDDVSLNVERGNVTALLGPNGAGKTTLVRILTTLLDPDSGSVRVAGFDAVRDAQALRSIIGLAGQYAAVDESLTGKENLEMVGRLYHLSAKQARARSQELLAQFELEEAANRTVKTYSGGMRRRLDLAASLVIKPQVLFLDEPTTGLDPHGRFTLWRIIRDLVDGGTTVLLTTQYLEEADQLARQIFVIDHGKIIAQGTPDELKRQVGGDVLELHMTNNHQAAEAAELIGRFGQEAARADESSGVVTMPVEGGSAVLLDVARELDGAALPLRDIILRRPSLDDVFIKLTGHAAE